MLRCDDMVPQETRGRQREKGRNIAQVTLSLWHADLMETSQCSQYQC
jgi:hypothetical protein